MTAAAQFTYSPFTYYGGKQRMAAELARLLPESSCYVEVFGGAATVLFSRPVQRKVVEVYNDSDDLLVTFFRVLRDRPDELVRALQLTPFARTELELARVGLNEPGIDDVERARRFFVRVSAGWGGSPTTSGWGGQRIGGNAQTRPITISKQVDRLYGFAERLRFVQVECLDWRKCIDRYDEPTAAFYLDPPYVPATRNDAGGGYRHEMTIDDHRRLVERVLELQGSFVLSGYDHEVYAPLDDVCERFEYRTRSTAAASNGKPAVEVVWRRHAAGAIVQERFAI